MFELFSRPRHVWCVTVTRRPARICSVMCPDVTSQLHVQPYVSWRRCAHLSCERKADQTSKKINRRTAVMAICSFIHAQEAEFTGKYNSRHGGYKCNELAVYSLTTLFTFSHGGLHSRVVNGHCPLACRG